MSKKLFLLLPLVISLELFAHHEVDKKKDKQVTKILKCARKGLYQKRGGIDGASKFVDLLYALGSIQVTQEMKVSESYKVSADKLDSLLDECRTALKQEKEDLTDPAVLTLDFKFLETGAMGANIGNKRLQKILTISKDLYTAVPSKKFECHSTMLTAGGAIGVGAAVGVGLGNCSDEANAGRKKVGLSIELVGKVGAGARVGITYRDEEHRFGGFTKSNSTIFLVGRDGEEKEIEIDLFSVNTMALGAEYTRGKRAYLNLNFIPVGWASSPYTVHNLKSMLQ